MNVIEAKNVTKIYKPLDFWKKEQIVAIRNINLEIKKGEVFGLLGLNGAGKTTLMKIFLGLLKPTSGTVRIFNDTIENRKIRERIGYMSELPYFPKYLKAYEILDYFADLFNIDPKIKKDKINEVLEIVRLSGRQNFKIKAFSKGMQGRLGLAQALLNDPEILFLDEPMSGFDPLGYKETRDIIIELNKKGKTIFFNSHILSEVEKVCDRVGVLHRKEIIDVQPIDQILKKHKNLEDYFINIINDEKVKK